MKKWHIVFLVLAMAAVIAVKQYGKNKQGEGVPAPAQPAQSAQPEGQALPREALETPGVTGQQMTASIDPLSFAEANTQYCEGVSVNRIMSDYGRLWGAGVKDYLAFPKKEQEAIIEYVTSYYACRSAVSGPDVCTMLPDYMADPVNKESGPLSHGCLEGAERIFLPGYMAGREKKPEYCGMLREWDGQPPFPIGDEAGFCSAAVSGMEKICSSIKPQLSPAQLAKCYAEFPRNASDCAGNKESLERLAVYSAVKAKNAALCPSGIKEACSAYVSGSPTPCASIAKELSTKYCGFLASLAKQSFGKVGITQAEFQSLLKEEELKKAELKRQKAEQEKVIKSINESIRKEKGSGGGK